MKHRNETKRQIEKRILKALASKNEKLHENFITRSVLVRWN